MRKYAHSTSTQVCRHYDSSFTMKTYVHASAGIADLRDRCLDHEHRLMTESSAQRHDGPVAGDLDEPADPVAVRPAPRVRLATPSARSASFD
jgi:hypothetical protein